MRCAHPEEFVPQWPSDNASVHHARRKVECGTNSQLVWFTGLFAVDPVPEI